jgi:HlyD family secretion protein
VLLVSLGVFIATNRDSKNANQDNHIVKKGSIVEAVEVSGQIESADDVSLAFEKSGTVSVINYKAGDKVAKGAIIMSLSAADSLGRVREAEATLMGQQSELSRLKAGATAAEIALKTQNLDNSKLELANAKSQVEDTVKSSDIAIRNIIAYNLSSLFTKSSNGYSMTFITCDQSYQSIIEGKRKDFDTISITDISTAKGTADKLSVFVGDVNALVNLPCSSADQSLDAKRTQASAAKIAVSGVINEISSKISLLQNAESVFKRSEKDLALTSEGTDKNRISFQESQVNAASARLLQARAELNKSSIVSPISGVVGSLDVELGESISPSKSLVRVIGDSALEIKANISENDIAKITINNKASVTLDAYPEDEFEAVVSVIEPAATIISGVPRYGVVLLITGETAKIKVGMTANALIATKIKSDVIAAPTSYIKIKGNTGLVNKLSVDGKSSQEVTVKTGIRDNEGNIEILKGLSEGDILVKNK